MKRKTVFILAKSATALALLVGLFFLLPKTKNCCDEFDPEFEKLIVRGHAGELDAIKTLYEQAKKDGVKPMEELWALEGALAGDKALRVVYVEIFKTQIDAERQQRLLSSIKERSTMPGAPCLLESLGVLSSNRSACK